MLKKRYNSINDELRRTFGKRVFKVSLESGFSCPNRDGTIGKDGCIFCNPASYHPATLPDGDIGNVGIRRQLEEGISYIAKRHRVDRVIAYFQNGSNTHGPLSKLSTIFHEAIDHPSVVGLAISTRPDCIHEEHLDLLEDLSRKTYLWVELGLQSAHDQTLKLLERGHTVAKFEKAASILRSRGIRTCAHAILGLPNETTEMMLETARFLNEMNVWGVKIHNLHVLRGTKLETIYNEGSLKVASLKEYASWVVDFLGVLNPDMIIHRLNSHSPKALTVAPEWSVNKLAIFNEVERQLAERNTWQGGNFSASTGRRPTP